MLDLQCLTRLFSLISWPIGASQGSFSAFCKHNIRERSTPGASASYIRCHSSSNRLKAGRPPRDPQWAAGEPQLCRLITLHPHMGKMRACAHMKAHFKSFLTSPHLLGSEQKILVQPAAQHWAPNRPSLDTACNTGGASSSGGGRTQHANPVTTY